MNLPNVSFVIATYNGKRDLDKCLNTIYNQDYPKDKLEVVMVDGGSTDGTLKLADKYPVKLLHNKYKVQEGKYMGKYQGVNAATGEFIVLVDQDNFLIGNDWLKGMLQPFFDDSTIAVSGSQLAVVKSDSLTNRYLSLVGTDPFAVYRSLEGKMALGLLDKPLEKKQGYYIYYMDSENQICAGNNGYVYRKSDFDAIGGYDQDVEVLARLSKLGKNKLAIPFKPRLHHYTATGFFKFLNKRVYWGYYYLAFNTSNRGYSWLPKNENEKLVFWKYILFNLLILPNMLVAVKHAIKDREIAWLMHPWGMFLITLIYIIGVVITPEGIGFTNRFLFKRS